MFTGLIQRVGVIRRISRGRGLVVEIAAERPWATPLAAGESVAVNGVCLTVVNGDYSRFTADVLAETESVTGLGGAAPGTRVNLERALRAGDPLGGHLVQGHVERRGTVAAVTPRARDFRLTIRCGRVFAARTVLRGSVAIDGVSLTVSALGEDFFAVDIIPTTAAETTLGRLKAGDEVNLEGDILTRAAARPSAPATGGLTERMLADAGFL